MTTKDTTMRIPLIPFALLIIIFAPINAVFQLAVWVRKAWRKVAGR